MRIDRFHCQQTLAQNSEVKLETDLSHRLTRVLLLNKGHQITLFNGEGGEYCAEIIAIERSVVTVKITQFIDISRESPLQTHLAQALCKADKMDWVVQKATELGVNHITPLITEFCEVKLDAKRSAKKRQHWQNIMISASEQCGRTTIPTISAPISFSEWVTTADNTVKTLCHPGEQSDLFAQSATDISITIGPEGGFSDNEVTLAGQHQFQFLTLGPRLLRTETAGLVALTQCQMHWGDLITE